MGTPQSGALEQGGGWFLHRAYAGQVPLWKAFWLFFIPAPLSLYGIYIGALWVHLHLFKLARLELFAIASSLAMFLFMAVPCSAVWRCAANTQHRYWGYLAQFVVATYLIWYGMKVLSIWTISGH
jgi:hypothetical protein